VTIVVIGAGIVGASVAYHLGERTEEQVIVYERGELASETTAKSGSFFGFHVAEEPTPYEMKRYGLSMYNRLLKDSDEWVRTTPLGRLEIARSKGNDRMLRGRFADARDNQGAVSEYLTGSDIERSLLVPDIRTSSIEGAIYRPNVACFQPRQMARLLAERARTMGVQFETNTAVRDLLTANGTVVGVETESGQTRADHVVCTVGPWVNEFADAVGLDLPAQHTLGPMLRLRPDDPIGERLPSLKDHDSGVYLRRDFDGTLLVGHRPGGYEEGTRVQIDNVPDSVPDGLREDMRTTSVELVPALSDAELVEEWVGVRTLTPDGFPIVDSNTVEGLSLTVMNAEGMQLAPATGRIIANRLTTGRTPTYDTDITLSRFT
jgi:glycine/D-amino acid oxidase-like deaminating enzyme